MLWRYSRTNTTHQSRETFSKTVFVYPYKLSFDYEPNKDKNDYEGLLIVFHECDVDIDNYDEREELEERSIFWLEYLLSGYKISDFKEEN